MAVDAWKAPTDFVNIDEIVYDGETIASISPLSVSQIKNVVLFMTDKEFKNQYPKHCNRQFSEKKRSNHLISTLCSC